jgi:hypothetical protein
VSGKVFINYRRGDDAGFTQALFQRLEGEFTPSDLFMDVEGHIKPGDDFVEVLNRQVAACDVLLVVIGPRWADLLVARAGDRDDFVAIEIKAALEHGKRVIPVLVGGAAMPRAETLPEPIRALARRNAVGLRPERFKADCQGLISALKEQLSAAENERAKRTEVERAAAEGERRKREVEQAARLAAAEEQARKQAVAGLSPDDVRKAEELANWDFVKERSDASALRDHIARFPGGVTALYASTKLEEIVWAGLGSLDDEASLKAFLDEFPKGAHAQAARTRLSALENRAAEAQATHERRAQETGDWAEAAASGQKETIEAFLLKWPAGQHSAAARARLKELGGPPTRRRVLQGAGAAGGLATLGGGLYLWQRDRSIRTFEAEGRIKALSISPDGKLVISTVQRDREEDSAHLKLWDLEGGRALRTLCCHRDVQCVVFSTDGKWALSGGYGDREMTGNGIEVKPNNIKLWEIDTGRQFPSFAGYEHWVNSIAFAPDGKSVLSGGSGRDDEALLWDFGSRRELQRFKGHTEQILSVAFAPDGKLAASGGQDNKLFIWDVGSGAARRYLVSEDYVRSVAFSPDGRVVISTSGKAVRLYDVESGHLRRTFEGHTGSVEAVALSPDGKRMLSGSTDETLKLWDVEKGQVLRTLGGHSSHVSCVAFLPGGKFALSGSADQKLKLWDVS